MSGWHSLQGYLGYRPSGALGRLKAKKRQWFVFDERNCQILFYKNETDVGCKPNQGSIDLRSAAVSLNMDDPNQFIIHSQGKEHIFTAETHESTMIWLLALQAKRDTFNNRMSLMVENGSMDLKEKEDLKRKESLPSDQEIQQMISRAKCAENGCMENGLNRVHGQESLGGFGGLLRSKSVRENRPSSVSYFSNRFRDHLFRNACVDQHRRSVDLGTVSSSPRSSPAIYRLRNFSGGSVATTDSEDTDTSVGCRSAPHSPQIVPDVDISFASDTPEPSISGTPPLIGEQSNCNHMSFLQASLDNINSHLTASLQQCINSTGNGIGSNGTFIISDRLKELEIDLLTSKLEIAKALNREATLKDELEGKESIIHHLESQLKESSDKKKVTLDDVPPVNNSSQRLHEKCRILQNQNRYLNEEVLKLSRMWQQEQMKCIQQNQKSHELEVELDRLKRDYVFILQSSIRVAGGDGPELIEVPIYGGSRNRKRISKLLEEARKSNPGLPSLEGMAKLGCHVDNFGFKHCYVDEGLMLHYLCGQLNNHYISHLSSVEHNQRRWKEILKNSEFCLLRTKEVKNLVRCGIPNHFRSQVWGLLVHEKVKSIKETKGPLYYDHLRSLVSESEIVLSHRRQISLDLLRTMPNNVHFNDIEADGVKKMQDVLQAFCLHNSSVGYCQGMNFIVGMALLFMKAEDAFWFLVAITEKYFPPYYFDQNLLGAQADQEVLKDVLTIKLPALAKHFNSIDIELSTVTLNWFLSIFFDSIPFESLLRIWDCFLYEGPKVLFRFSMAILKMNETCLLEKSNTISIMRQLKASSKFCFDIDGLIKTAFEDLKPFPRRGEIVSKQTCYLKTLKEKLKKRNLEKEALENKEKMFDNNENAISGYVVECCAFDGENLWLCEGQQQKGRIVKINCLDETKQWLDIQLDSRIMCIQVIPDLNIMFLGALAHCLYIYNISSRELIGQLKLNDSVLSICSYEDNSKKRLYIALADGTIGVLEWLSSESIPNFEQKEIFYIMISSSAVTYLKLIDRRLWCASSNRIIILHATTLDTIDQFTVSTNTLDSIACITESKHGIWVLLRGTFSFQLWDPQNLVCRLMFNTGLHNSPIKSNESDYALCRLTTILSTDKSIWIGTNDGHIIIYDVQLVPSRKTSAFSSPGQYVNIDGPSMELVNEKIQELYNQQCELKTDYDTSLKYSRGRSDSGYQTVGDASKENSVIAHKNDDLADDDKTPTCDFDFKRKLCILEMTPGESDNNDEHFDSWASSTLCGNTSNDKPPQLLTNVHGKDPNVLTSNRTSNNLDLNLRRNNCRERPSRMRNGGLSSAGSCSYESNCQSKSLANSSNFNSDEVSSIESHSKCVTGNRKVRRSGHHSKNKNSKLATLPKLDLNNCRKFKGLSRSISDLVTKSPSRSHDSILKYLKSKACRSFDEIAHLLGGSGDSVLSSPTCGSFDFDDVFISYTEEDRRVNNHKGKLNSKEFSCLKSSSRLSVGNIPLFNGDGGLSETTSDFTSAGNEYSSSGVEETVFRKSKKKDAIYRSKSCEVQSKFNAKNKLNASGSSHLQGNANISEKNTKDMSRNDCNRGIARKSSISSLEEHCVEGLNVDYDSVQETKYLVRAFQTRKDNNSGYFKESDSGSFISLSECDIPYNVDLVLREKVKVSVKPIKCLIAVEKKGEPTVIYSCSESSHEPDAILQWTLMNTNCNNREIWRQKSVVDASHRRPSVPSQIRRAPSPSILTNADFSLSAKSTSIVNATSNLVGNGIAKVQNIISNFNTDT